MLYRIRLTLLVIAFVALVGLAASGPIFGASNDTLLYIAGGACVASIALAAVPDK